MHVPGLDALSDAEDHGAIRMPLLVPQPMDGQSSAAEPSHSTAQDVICNAANSADNAAAMGSSAASQAESMMRLALAAAHLMMISQDMLIAWR